MGAAAVAAARAVDYVGAGTVEFLLDAAGNPYFLEMNTRLQVEHPVTEAVTGLDLVRLQLSIAAGKPYHSRRMTWRCAATRSSAGFRRNSAAGFFASGTLRLFAPPSGPGIRNDVGVATGDTVGVDYDPQLAKSHTSTRPTVPPRSVASPPPCATESSASRPICHSSAGSSRTRSSVPGTRLPPSSSGSGRRPLTAELPPLPREVLLGAAALDMLGAGAARGDRRHRRRHAHAEGAGGVMITHLLSASDLDPATATTILDTAAELANVTGREVKKLPTLRGRTVINLFYEDSTRTRFWST